MAPRLLMMSVGSRVGPDATALVAAQQLVDGLDY